MYGVINELSVRGKCLVADFVRRYISKIPKSVKGKLVYEESKSYYGVTRDKSEYRLQTNQLDDFLKFLEKSNVFRYEYEYEHEDSYEGVDVSISIFEKWIPKDYQLSAWKYVEATRPYLKLLSMETGTGKTITSLMIASKLGKRTMLIVPNDAIDQWETVLPTVVDVHPSDIVKITGRAKLMKLLISRVLPKIMLISNRSILGLIKDYEEHGTKATDGFRPEEIFYKLGIGTIVVDEAHADFYTNYKIMLYVPVSKPIYMTATLLSSDRFMKDLYLSIFPENERFMGPKVTPYVDGYSCSYGLQNPKKVNTKARGSIFYSHVEFEKSIFRQPLLKRKYAALTSSILEEGYMARRGYGEQALILVTTVEMATWFTEYIRETFPELKTVRYAKTEGDKFESIVDADVIVATVKSAAKALDLSGLILLILTVSIMSPNAVKQIKGRLRQPKTKMASRRKLYWLYCEHINKHVEYDRERKELLRDELTFIMNYNTGRVL